MTVDVAVVGGGPAGSATALRLAQMGFEVALFDRSVFPRSKPCGEFVNPEAARLLREELGVDMPSDAAPVWCASLIPESGEPLNVPLLDKLGGPAIGYSLRRIRTDAILLDSAREAGVQVFEGSNVRSATVEGISGNWTDGGPFECRARLIVACDGSHSKIARQRRLVRSIARLRRIGVVAHYSGVTRAPEGVVQMYTARQSAWGVAGFSMQSHGQAVLSAVVPVRAAAALSIDREGFVHRMANSLPGLCDALAGAALNAVHTAPSFGHRLLRPFDDGVLFVGDSAQFVDPFTGEGVHHALAGALLASEVARTALERGDFTATALSPYGSSRRDLNRRYAACDLIQAFVNRPWLIELAARNLRGRPRAAERLFAAITDILPASTVWSPRVVAGALIPSFQ